MKKIGVLLLIVLVALIAYLGFWPVPVKPVAWEAPKAPELIGPYAPNQRLASVQRLAQDQGLGPETVITDAKGHIYTGYEDGRIVRFNAKGQSPDLITNTGGRPFGLAFTADGQLIVADGIKGLLSVDPASGQITLLTNSADGVPFAFADDVTIAADGMIYFTDASSRFGPARHGHDAILEHRSLGRLLRYNPANGKTRVLLKGLAFANGVALSESDNFILVNETGNYDIVRYWLAGPKAGTHDIFAANLPGIPDGLSRSEDGTFWVALFSPRIPILDKMAAHPFLRKVAFRLPAFLQPQPARQSLILGLNAKGEVTHYLQASGKDAFSPVTSVWQYQNTLYLGSLTETSIGVFRLPMQQHYIHRTESNCEPPACRQVDIRWLTFSDQPDLNQHIKQALLAQLQVNGADTRAGDESLAALADNFLQKDEAADFPMQHYWQLNGKVKQLSHQNGILTLAFDSYRFTGGAHGMPASHWLNWDTRAHQPIQLDQLIRPGKEKAFWQLADKAYSQWAEGKFHRNSFYPDKDAMRKTQDFRLTQAGVKLLYQPYDIAPYAAGMPQLTLPASQVAGLIKSQYRPEGW